MEDIQCLHLVPTPHIGKCMSTLTYIETWIKIQSIQSIKNDTGNIAAEIGGNHIEREVSRHEESKSKSGSSSFWTDSRVVRQGLEYDSNKTL